MREDHGAIVIGWLTKLVVFLAVLGVIGFDAMSIGLTKIGVTDDAETAAEVAAATYQNTHNTTSAYEAAAQAVDASGTEVVARSFRVASNGTVTLTTTRTANTILLRYWAPTRKWTVATYTIVEKPNKS